RHPDIVELLTIGKSRSGDSIEAIKIGHGPKKALLFAMPHPNEPIGSMMLEFLSSRLAEDEELREVLGYTWYLVKCIDPDGTRLNEGWFKSPFSLENYARNYYRPPAYQQVAWTFPIDYKSLHFDDPIPETQALMGLIEQVRPDFMYSLHNSDFGGVYYFIWEAAPPLYDQFHKLVENQGLPLHMGESERPYEEEFASAIYRDSSISEEYDYLKEHTETDPAEIITGGTLSFEYARRFCDPFSLICEMPYFYNPAINDISPSDIQRRDALLQAINESRESVEFLAELYDAVKGELTVPSLFRDAIEENLRTSGEELAVEEEWVRTNPKADGMATVAEKFDNLVIQKYYRLTMLGMFLRMLQVQISKSGTSSALISTLETAREAFDVRAAALEAEIDYSVIPIQKLVRVQLGSGLLAAHYTANVRSRGVE
ncbi:MAG: M14 family zinc carboxypeptidase, partial [Anaerolineales bacterium]